MVNNARLRQIEKIYAPLPAINCKGDCHHSCRGIQLSVTESHNIRKRTGVLFRGNLPGRVCPFLDRETKLCTVHDIRPLVCRLYGVTQRMQCPHGCTPERLLTDEEEFALINEVMWIGGGYSDGDYLENKKWLGDPEFFVYVREAMYGRMDWESVRQKVQAIERTRCEKR